MSSASVTSSPRKPSCLRSRSVMIRGFSVAAVAAERAITLVKDSLSIVPMGRRSGTTRVVSITIAPRTDLGAGVTFNGELSRVFPQLRTLTLSPEAAFDATAGAAAGGTGAYIAAPAPRILSAAIENALRASQGAEIVVVSSYFGASTTTSKLAAPEGMAQLIDGVQKSGAKVLLATFSNPYIASSLPATSSYLIAWGGLPVSQRAAARAALGLAPISGQLPITIPAVAPYGAGLRRESIVIPASAPTP